MAEKAKRLAPKGEVLRELFLKSGNLCAFPSCSRLMLNASGNFVGQLCHIEAAEDGGERFNQSMTNEQRRAASNLLLLCYEHHVETNDVHAFPVSRMQTIKADHEKRFSHPDRVILNSLKDYTTLNEATIGKNLRKLDRLLGWNHSAEELEGVKTDLEEYLEKFSKVPVEIRKFVGEVAQRMWRIRDLPAVQREGFGNCPMIRFDDLQQAFQINEEQMYSYESQLDSYGLGFRSEMSDRSCDRWFPGLKLRATKYDWCLWESLAEFCEKAGETIDVFSVEMDFARLDEAEIDDAPAEQS
jgi:hypothetical protein